VQLGAVGIGLHTFLLDFIGDSGNLKVSGSDRDIPDTKAKKEKEEMDFSLFVSDGEENQRVLEASL